MIPVTKTFIPDFDEYTHLLRRVWESGWLTNNGQLVVELEQQLREYLGVKHLFLVSNGTVALQLAIKVLGLRGEIITTPFSYVATTASIVWEGCTPVFVDIDATTLCLNADLVEQAITPATRAILATHVYGGPCAVDELARLGHKYNIKVIYDAAHAFGVRHQGQPLLRYGDVSAVSFHATKLFHTGEGGAVVTNDDEVAATLDYLRNFGHADEYHYHGLGINAKNSELHAAMGLCVLPQVARLVAQRRLVSERYDAWLLPQGVGRPVLAPGTEYNYAYYAIVLASEAQLLAVMAALAARDVFPRRYFYPALSELPYVRAGHLPCVAELSRRVLCLPLYHDLALTDVDSIAGLIIEHL